RQRLAGARPGARARHGSVGPERPARPRTACPGRDDSTGSGVPPWTRPPHPVVDTGNPRGSWAPDRHPLQRNPMRRDPILLLLAPRGGAAQAQDAPAPALPADLAKISLRLADAIHLERSFNVPGEGGEHDEGFEFPPIVTYGTSPSDGTFAVVTDVGLCR